MFINYRYMGKKYKFRVDKHEQMKLFEPAQIFISIKCLIGKKEIDSEMKSFRCIHPEP